MSGQAEIAPISPPPPTTIDHGLSNKTWETLWNSGFLPGGRTDEKSPLPELTYQVIKRTLPSGGVAVVLGSIRASDAAVLSLSGNYHSVICVDNCATSVEAVRRYLSALKPALPKNWSVQLADILATTSDAEGVALAPSAADLVYDYSFFSSVAPARRAEWGQRMASLVRRGGFLITVMFPMKKNVNENKQSPLSIETYQTVLATKFTRADGPRLLRDDRSHPSRAGRTWWCLWNRC